ncbi:MAG: sigma-70 family RNA polymerase sigma factor [Candidatus Coatesbacteria bacterium]|nr:sigma-70 family RNA polymerase sigma factor [Candidatus Coatesbacteria bacterium]
METIHGENLEFLKDLVSSDIVSKELAWQSFLTKYSSLIRHISYKLTVNRDQDDCEDLYIYIIEHLYQDDFSSLKQYSGLSKFSTWLGRVSYNLGVDHLREKYGRRRLYESIKTLSREDQRLFELYFWEGYSENEICELLSSEFNKIYPLDEIIERLLRIEENLSSKKKWQLISDICKNKPHLSLTREDMSDDGEEKDMDFPDLKEEPQSKIENEEKEEKLMEILKKLTSIIEKLSSDDKIIIKGYFLDGMKIKEISLLTNIPEKKIYKKIASIKEKIKIDLESYGVSEELINIILMSILFFSFVSFGKLVSTVRI